MAKLEADAGSEPVGEVIETPEIDPNEPSEASPANDLEDAVWPVTEEIEPETETVVDTEPVTVDDEEAPPETEELETNQTPTAGGQPQAAPFTQQQLMEHNLLLMRQLQQLQAQVGQLAGQTAPGNAAVLPGTPPAPQPQSELPPPITAQKIAEMFAADPDDPAVKELAGAFTSLHGQITNQGRKLDEIATWTNQEQISRSYSDYVGREWNGFLGSIAESERPEVEPLFNDLLQIGQKFNCSFPDALAYWRGKQGMTNGQTVPADQARRQGFNEALNRQKRNRTAMVTSTRPKKGTPGTARPRTPQEAYQMAKAEGFSLDY